MQNSIKPIIEKEKNNEFGKRPSISIIVAVFNGAQTLQRAIDSVSNQVYPYKELIIIDGASSDGTLEVIKKNLGRIDYWVSEKDAGIHHAWNKAIQVSKGEWLYFLGADDALNNKNVLSEFRDICEDVDNQLIYGQVMVMTKDWVTKTIMDRDWRGIKTKFLNSENRIPHQATFHHRNLFHKYGRFDESLKIAGDYDFLLRCYLNGEEPYYVEKYLVSNIMEGGMSNNYAVMLNTFLEFGKIRKKHKLKIYSLRYIWLLCKGTFYKLLSYVT